MARRPNSTLRMSVNVNIPAPGPLLPPNLRGKSPFPGLSPSVVSCAHVRRMPRLLLCLARSLFTDQHPLNGHVTLRACNKNTRKSHINPNNWTTATRLCRPQSRNGAHKAGNMTLNSISTRRNLISIQTSSLINK